MKRRVPLLPLLLLCLAGAIPLRAPAQPAPGVITYVVLGGSGPVARAVLGGSQACPGIDLDGATQAMAQRQIPSPLAAAFPVTVCETLIPATVASASIQGQKLPLPPRKLKSIAGIGDTGCRLKNGKDDKAGKAKPTGAGAPPDAAAAAAADHDHEDANGKYQDCDVPGQWPFAQLAANVAKAAPGVVLHVGDYLYREAACPANDAGCKGSPYGDNWLTWQADFFTPAAPLLRAAPWVAVRGNHEICARNGAGYLVFLDPRLADNGAIAPCTDIFPSYTAQAGGQAFVVIDTSNADDQCTATACNSAAYRPVFAALSPPANSWLVTHKPLWAVRKGPTVVTASLQDALQGGQLPAGVSLALAGHIHFWQLLSFADARAPQFVLGNGGTLLAKEPKEKLPGTQIAGTQVSFAKTHDKWGYTLFSPQGSGWKASYYSTAGNKKFDCEVKGGKAGC